VDQRRHGEYKALRGRAGRIAAIKGVDRRPRGSRAAQRARQTTAHDCGAAFRAGGLGRGEAGPCSLHALALKLSQVQGKVWRSRRACTTPLVHIHMHECACNTRMCTHTHTHTPPRADHAHIHRHLRTPHLCTHIYTRIRTQVYIHIWSCAHTYTHAYSHKLTHSRTHMHMHTNVHPHTNAPAGRWRVPRNHMAPLAPGRAPQRRRPSTRQG
jgi:hypothetical protein